MYRVPSAAGPTEAAARSTVEAVPEVQDVVTMVRASPTMIAGQHLVARIWW
jgi:hypothetical protein